MDWSPIFAESLPYPDYLDKHATPPNEPGGTPCTAGFARPRPRPNS